MFVDKIGGKGGAGAEHEHGFVQAHIGSGPFEQGMTNALLVACVAIQAIKRFFECRMLQ